ncbi:site-specific integrase [Amycolatopsis sp. DG1A-15b]|uniref:tyrosine-type recombinase/integrase n=1 Tax=Amycolatopsis sp. DG1A-15b TaxID=3052846 RepID=UPI00255B9203|nr:site-specific integrase [Amycolatopsis sp. DG1A-15b]WIX85714.1 tyrosine-type recombinase/integrase [Amycolatopsis sp. DG1A-15b]
MITEVSGLTGEPQRAIDEIRLPRWGRVVAAEGSVPWVVVGPDDVVVAPIREFLTEFVAMGRSPGSVRSYAYDLLRWWRWLLVAGIEWNRATEAEPRDFVLWLRQAVKPRRSSRTTSAELVGTVNPITRKQYLGDGYQPRTVRHSNAVVRAFYEYWIDRGEGPVVNPVPRDPRGGRSNAHHNPLQPFRAEGRIRYNPKVPKRRPRELPEALWRDVFGALRSNRDRALLATAVSNGARAAELLGVRAVDLDWGDQLVRVVRKGSGAEQWLPTSAEAFVWIRLYLADLGEPLAPDSRLWWTLRRRDQGRGLSRQPLNYEALRAVFRRVNGALGTNWTMHDLRHTAALRMSRDENLSLKDVQVILGHAHLSTTADVYVVEDEAQIVRRVGRHLTDRTLPAAAAPVAVGYDAADLDILLGGLR